MRCFGLPLFLTFLFPIPFLSLVQLLENSFQLQPLTVKNQLELLALTGSCHDSKLFSMRALDALFRFVVRLISDEDNSKRHPSFHIDLWFK